MADNIIAFARKSYVANLQRFEASGLDIRIAGTLDGIIDLAITGASGAGCTYSLTCDDARRIIAGLNFVTDDIQAHCLFERDPLLHTRQ